MRVTLASAQERSTCDQTMLCGAYFSTDKVYTDVHKHNRSPSSISKGDFLTESCQTRRQHVYLWSGAMKPHYSSFVSLSTGPASSLCSTGRGWWNCSRPSCGCTRKVTDTSAPPSLPGCKFDHMLLQGSSSLGGTLTRLPGGITCWTNPRLNNETLSPAAPVV